ncbi:MAG: hypothetical protein NTU57_02495 [Candidatus Aenigmarchaeota archaeon]|nr:hypothetical protein [Candidatus Aenigmarchaeota archaeon]
MLNNSWELYIAKLNNLNKYGLSESDIKTIAGHFNLYAVGVDDSSQELVETLIEEYKKNAGFPISL